MNGNQVTFLCGRVFETQSIHGSFKNKHTSPFKNKIFLKTILNLADEAFTLKLNLKSCQQGRMTQVLYLCGMIMSGC